MVHLDAQKMEDFKERYRYLLIILGMAFLLLIARLWYLQTLRGSEFRRISENNCIRIREQPGDRGLLLDRKGRVIARNRPSFEVYLIPEDLKRYPEVVGQVAQLLKLNQGEIEERIKSAKRRAPFKPVRIKPDIEWNELPFSNRIASIFQGCGSMSAQEGAMTMGLLLPISSVTLEKWMRMSFGRRKRLRIAWGP